MSGEIWSDQRIRELSDLWHQTSPLLATKEIGRRMSVSKNAIVGKAHRLGFVGRPSPIKRDHIKQESQAVVRERPAKALPRLEPSGVTLPPLPSMGTPAAPTVAISKPSPTWASWVGTLTTRQFNVVRQSPHKAECPVARQSGLVRLWECTCGATQPGARITRELVESQITPAVVLPAVPAVVSAVVPSAPVIIVPVELVVEEPEVTQDIGPAIASLCPPEVQRAPSPMSIRSRISCDWPIGDPGTKTFTFCGEPTEGRHPYCLAHCTKSYVRVREPKPVDEFIPNRWVA